MITVKTKAEYDLQCTFSQLHASLSTNWKENYNSFEVHWCLFVTSAYEDIMYSALEQSMEVLIFMFICIA